MAPSAPLIVDTSTRFWFRALSAFFRGISGNLAEVLDAQSCREAWLQGEMFRWFRKHRQVGEFWTNAFSISKRCNADIGADTPFPMRGELKVLGANFGHKVLTGGALSPLLPHLHRPLTPTDGGLVRGPWGLLPDYFRLQKVPWSPGASRLLVMVAHIEKGASGAVADALRLVTFSGTVRNLSFEWGFVRIWDV